MSPASNGGKKPTVVCTESGELIFQFSVAWLLEQLDAAQKEVAEEPDPRRGVPPFDV